MPSFMPIGPKLWSGEGFLYIYTDTNSVELLIDGLLTYSVDKTINQLLKPYIHFLQFSLLAFMDFRFLKSYQNENKMSLHYVPGKFISYELNKR